MTAASVRVRELPPERVLEFAESLPAGQRERVIDLAGKWKHGWIPLDAIAAAIKAKQMKGDGIRRPSANVGAIGRRPSGKSRLDARGAAQRSAVVNGARAKARPSQPGRRPAAPSSSTPAPRPAAPSSDIRAKAAEAVRLKAPELKARAAQGDKVAAAELERRASNRAAKQGAGTAESTLEDRYSAARTPAEKHAAASALADHYAAKGKTTQAKNWRRAAAKHSPDADVSPDRAHTPEKGAAAAAALQAAHDAKGSSTPEPGVGAMTEPELRHLAGAGYGQRSEQARAELERRTPHTAAVAGVGDGAAVPAGMPTISREDAMRRLAASYTHAELAAELKRAKTGSDAHKVLHEEGVRRLQQAEHPDAPPRTEAPGSVTAPAAAAKAKRKPSALHQEYRARREEQDRRFEAHVGGGIAASDTHTQEYKDYFGVGDHSTSTQEQRLTFKSFLEERRQGAEHERRAQAAYDAGAKLGTRHGQQNDSSQHEAEYRQHEGVHGQDHADVFASGYSDGIIAGSKAAEEQQAKAKHDAWQGARDKAGAASMKADREDTAAAHRAAVLAHADAGQKAIDAGARDGARHHIAQAQKHKEAHGRAKAREDRAADPIKADEQMNARLGRERRSNEAAVIRQARDQQRNAGHAERVARVRESLAGKSDAELAKMVRDHPLSSSSLPPEQKRALAAVLRERAAAARARGAESATAPATETRQVSRMVSGAEVKVGDLIGGSRVTSIGRRGSGARDIHVEGGDRAIYVAPGKRIKVTREEAAPKDDAGSSSRRVGGDAATRAAAGTQEGRITAARLEPGDRIRVARNSDGSLRPTRSMKGSEAVEVLEARGAHVNMGDRTRLRQQVRVRHADGSESTMIDAPSQTHMLDRETFTTAHQAELNRKLEGERRDRQVIGTMSNHGEMVTVEHTNGKHRVKVDGRIHSSHDTREQAVAKAHEYVPEHRRANTEEKARELHRNIEQQAEADRRRKVAERNAANNPPTVTHVGQSRSDAEMRRAHPMDLTDRELLIERESSSMHPARQREVQAEISRRAQERAAAMPAPAERRMPEAEARALARQGTDTDRARIPGPNGEQRGDVVTLRNLGVSGERRAVYLGRDINGHPQYRGTVNGQMTTESVVPSMFDRIGPRVNKGSEIVPRNPGQSRFTPPPPAGTVRLERNQSIVLNGPRAGQVSEGTSAASSAPAAPSPAAGASSIRVEHSGDGTVVYGTERGDTETIDALKAQGFKWSRSLEGWYLPRTWSESTRELRVRGLQARLGDKLTVERGQVGKSTTAAERHAAEVARAEENAARHAGRAGKASTEAERRFGAADRATEGIPFGQPILVGHHSQRRHERALERAHSNMDAGLEAHRRAQEEERLAQSSAARARQLGDPRAAARRLERNEAELRKVERSLAGTSAEKYPEHRARLEAMRAELADKIEHDRTIAAPVLGQYGKHNVKPGDVVTIRGHASMVHSVGPKNVKVHTSVGPLPYPLTQIQGHGKLEDASTATLKKLLENPHERRRLPQPIIDRIESILRSRGEG